MDFSGGIYFTQRGGSAMSDALRDKYVMAKELAGVLDLSLQRVGQLAKAGVLTKHRVGSADRYLLGEAVQAYIANVREQLSSKEKRASSVDDKIKEADLQIKESKAKIAALQLAELEGTMHRAADVEDMTNDLVFAVRSMLMALPGRLAVDVAGAESAAVAADMIKREVNAMLGELAEYKYDPTEYRRRVLEREGMVLGGEDSDAG